MAVGTGVTEIADSEDEPLTSSPAAVSDPAVNKLSATAGQDAQATAWPHQESIEATVTQASSHTDLLDVDQQKCSADIEITYFDQADSQLPNEEATDNARACTVEASLRADTSPEAGLTAASVDLKDVCMDTDQADGKSDSPRDAEASPQEEPASGLIGPATSQIQFGEPQGDKQPQLQEQTPTTSAVVDDQQDRPLEDRFQGEPDASHDTILKQSQSECAHLASTERESNQHDDVCAVSQEDLEADFLAAPRSHNITDEATTDLLISTHRDHSATADSGEVVLDTANDPDSIELDAWSRAAELTVPGIFSDQQQTAKLRAPQDGVDTSNKSAATTTPPPSSDGLTTTHNDHSAGGDAPFAPESKPTDCVFPSEQHQRNGQSQETAAYSSSLHGVASKQSSMTASNEQAGEDIVPNVGNVKVAVERPTKTTNQSLQDTFEAQHEHGQEVEDEPSQVSKPTEAESEAQFTAAQVSEPISPRATAGLSPQETALVELRAQKAALLGSLRVQPSIQVIMEENDASDNDGEPTEAEIMAAANKIVKEHIKLLHDYNELKDVGQGLMGIIADQRGLRIVEIQDEFGIDADD